MKVCALTLFFSVIAWAAPSPAATFNLSETRDGSVYSFQSTASMFAFSFGPPGFLAVSRSNPVAGDVHDFNSHLQFSLASLAGVTGSQVTSAALVLQNSDAALYSAAHSVAPTSTVPFTVDLYASSAAWNSATTWATAPPPTTGSPITDVTLTDASHAATIVTTTFDVTSLVKSWLDGSLVNNGFILKGHSIVGNDNDGYASALFTSRGYNDPSVDPIAFVPQAGGPLLQITTVPEPSSIVLLALAAAGLFLWRMPLRGCPV